MPGLNNEYTRPMVTSGGCAYATLSDYNQNYFGRGMVGAPTQSQTRSNEIVIVPSFGGPGYNTFSTTSRPSCSGYYGMDSAYPSYPSCSRFSSSLCGSGN